MKTQTVTNSRLSIILLTVAAMLATPLIAMQFTKEVNWDLFDFIIAGILLLSTGLTIEFILRKVKTPKQRIILCAVVLFALFIIWAELAVGIFGSPIAGS